ncbi:MAG TPA: quinone oxidoreductase [Anaeromyxobacteraceae bacterium]|nr:quinone oxidoreductase [Anaeromyxobacteraceae bacterium]
MAKVIRIERTGGPEVMQLVDVAIGAPGPGEARLRQTAIGVDFVDVYHRTGLYALALPTGLGVEAVGMVEAIGRDVGHVRPGDRVAYIAGPGAYATARVVPADRLVRLPDSIDDRTAAGAWLKGITAGALVLRTYPVEAGETVLVHAAAGGVGLILCQWLNALGATVIGVVSTDLKAAVAKAHGCHHVVVSSREDFVARVRELTGGAGVPVVYDSVGKATFEGSLDCLQPLGTMVTFGNASGPVPPVDVGVLGRKGSLFLTRPSVFQYIARREDLERYAGALLDVIGRGKVKVEVTRTFALAEAAEAHRALEGRGTTGSLVLIP